MATSVQITDKSVRASELRTEAAAIERDLTQARERLALASKPLADLTKTRDSLAERMANGESVKLSAVADNRAAMEVAEMPLKLLRSRVTEKETALAQVRTNLATVEHEIGLEAQIARRGRRFDELATRGRETQACIAEKIRSLIEEDLPALDEIRDVIRAEFVNRNGALAVGPGDPETQQGRALDHELGISGFYDGSFLAVERRLLRAGWIVRGDIELPIKNLRPPKR